MVSQEKLNEIIAEANTTVRNARYQWQNDYSTKLGIEDYIEEAKMKAILTAVNKICIG